MKWIPWQLLARKAAKAYGFNDPIETLDRIRKFSRPSETQEPIELLRAGFAFHARGLANTKAIQNNLDWIWPYWIQRQYNPRDESFIPRAFSFSHINLTQRNWTATGLPDSDQYAIVDPRGLVTPFHDSWSIDFWIVTEDGPWLIPCQESKATQTIDRDLDYAITTTAERDDLSLTTTTKMVRAKEGSASLEVSISAKAPRSSRVAISVRPYNPEGIQFIDKISIDRSTNSITVNDTYSIVLPDSVNEFELSNYERGDVAHEINSQRTEDTIVCEAGMASAIALIPLNNSGRLETQIDIPVTNNALQDFNHDSWTSMIEEGTTIELPDKAEEEQFYRSRQTLAMLSPHDIYPGPYTYKRFWFRDACLIAHSLLRTGQFDTCRRALLNFPDRQTNNGYFLSQEGEWDSNGQVLWIYDLYERYTGKDLPEECFDSIKPATKWISNKLLNDPGKPHHGLLPPGFSAEHFGPNDYYYWDDFWAIAGLDAAGRIYQRRGINSASKICHDEAKQLGEDLESSLQNLSSRRAAGALPASPYRRLDSGAIGSMVVDYPLQLWPAGDERVIKTANFLYEKCVVDGAFFQDMIHSGWNVYLTLDLAQTFLRAGDSRWKELSDKCLEIASPTGQWPEAINPRTGGGCMGDGQHAWAASEWVLFTLNRIVREENDVLVIGSGVTDDWLRDDAPIRLNRAPTSFGLLDLSLQKEQDRVEISLKLTPIRRDDPPQIEIQLPGFERVSSAFRETISVTQIASSVTTS